MEENQVSRTAQLTACYRAYHSIHDYPKIFNDFLAQSIIEEGEIEAFGQQMVAGMMSFNPQLAASFSDESAIQAFMIQSVASTPLVLSRARYTEDILEKAISQGLKQYVILGAGMDTFAFRRPEMLEQIQVFEVDHPATQAFKRRRIAELGWEQPAQLHFIPIDFTQESLATALTRSSAYDQQALSFFNWLGVTYYLPRDTVFATLQSIADVAPAGSTVIFDYLDDDAFVPEKVAQRVQLLLWLANQEEEPMQAGFDPSTLESNLVSLGLRLKEDLSPTDIQERYFENRKDRYYACEHAHLAYAVVK